MMFEWMEHATQIKPGTFIRNPEEQQLIDEARLAVEERAPLVHQALAGLGRQLTDWGERLQERYDSAAQMPLDMPPLEKIIK